MSKHKLNYSVKHSSTETSSY